MAEDPSLRYRDFAILTRTGSASFAPMLPALLSAGIPAYADGGAGYFDTMEVMLALELLQLVVNGHSDRALIGVLRSGICGLTADELAQIRIDSPRTSYADAARLFAAGQSAAAGKVRGIFELLNSLRLRMGSTDLGELTRAAIAESGLYLYAGALPGGKQRQANLELLVDNASAYDRDVSGSLARFLKHTETLRERGDGDSAHALGENDDVVRLMTIHKSKGLEFRVVFGAMLHRRFRSPDASRPLLAHPRLGAGMAVYDPALRTRRSTLPWTAIAQREIRQGAAEEMRILYVLLTRAQERLILTGTVRRAESAMRRWSAMGGAFSAANSHLDFVMGALLDAKRQGAMPEVALSVRGAAELEFSRPKPELSALNAFDAALADPEKFADPELLEEMRWRYPDGDAARRPMKLTVSGLLRELEGPEVIAPMAERPKFLAETQGLTGAERGSAYHRAMQLLDLAPLRGLSGEALGRAVRGQLDGMDRERLFQPGQRDAVRPWNLTRFLESGLGRRLLAAEDVRREWPFNVLMRAADVVDGEEAPALDGELIVQGVIDCCFVENGAWILLDYKTDRADDPEQVAGRYRRQLDTYALALERITGMPVAETWLCLLGAGLHLKMEPRAAAEHAPLA
jgi:ATP-dependent helicase/nuclease subunit A